MRRFMTPAVVIAALAAGAHAQLDVTTVFTYQGRLDDAGVPASGNYDFEFRLFDAAAAGAPKGPMVPVNDLPIVDGLFTVPLDFGAEFPGSRRWVEIRVKPGIGGAFTTLPRQELTATPYALGVRLPLVQAHDTASSALSITNNSTGRVFHAIRGGAGGLSAIRADSAGDSALWGQGSTATAEGVSAISTGGANALNAQSQGTTGRAGSFEITNAANADAAILAATAGAGPALFADGLVQIGSGTTVSGVLRLFRSGSAATVLHGFSSPHGGNLDLFDEAGSFLAGFEADSDGQGGFAYVYRDGGAQAFTVDGNNGGTGEPRVTIAGDSRSAVFDMGDSGNDSVRLPSSAIAASEIFDEPGVASNTSNGTINLTPEDALVTILSRSITVPASGYVLVMGACQLQTSHTTGTLDTYDIGVSDDPAALPGNQDLFMTCPSALPSAIYQHTVSPHGLFTVAAGTHTFYLLGRTSAGDLGEVFDIQLTLAYFPTAYGTVVSTFLDGGGRESGTRGGVERTSFVRAGLTPTEIAAEREQSIAENYLRLQRELRQMQAQTLQLQKQLDEMMRAQQAAANEPRATRPSIEPYEEGR